MVVRMVAAYQFQHLKLVDGFAVLNTPWLPLGAYFLTFLQLFRKSFHLVFWVTYQVFL